MGKPFVRLDPRRPAVAAILNDQRALSVWEVLRRFRRPTTVAELAAACALPVSTVQGAVDLACEAGLASRARGRAAGSDRRGRYSATGDRIMVEVDPKSPADSRLMRGMFAHHLAESRSSIEQSLADAARGISGFGLKHAFAHVTLDEAEVKELLALFAPIDQMVARIAAKHDGDPGSTPRLCNYHLAFHVAPVSIERLPQAQIEMAPATVMPEKEAQAENAPSKILTGRELEIAKFLIDGLTAPQIAASLGISRSTVSTLCGRMYRKLGISRRAQLAVRMHSIGIR